MPLHHSNEDNCSHLYKLSPWSALQQRRCQHTRASHWSYSNTYLRRAIIKCNFSWSTNSKYIIQLFWPYFSASASHYCHYYKSTYNTSRLQAPMYIYKIIYWLIIATILISYTETSFIFLQQYISLGLCSKTSITQTSTGQVDDIQLLEFFSQRS